MEGTVLNIAELLGPADSITYFGDDVNVRSGEYAGYEPQPGDEILHVPSTISPEELWENFISKRRPVIIDGFPTDPEWQAHKWADLEHLRTLAGDATVKVEPIHPSLGHFGTGTTRRRTTFGQFLDVLHDPAEACKWYLTTQYDSESDEDSDEDEDEEEEDSGNNIDSEGQDLELPPASTTGGTGEDQSDEAPQLTAQESLTRKRKRDSEPASTLLSTKDEGLYCKDGTSESEQEDDSEEMLSVVLSDSEEEPDFDDVLPSPTNALVTDFPAQPKLMGGLVLQQCNLWLGSNGAVQPHGKSPPRSDNPKETTRAINQLPNTLPGKSSGLHHDFHDNLYALVSGQKRLLLFPPTAHRYLYPRGNVLRVHRNGLIVYEPRDHEIDRAIVENLSDPDSGNRSDDGDLEVLSFLRAHERTLGKQRNLSIRADGLTPLDAAKWRIRARARALAAANECAAAEAGEHRVRRDRRKGKGRQTKEQEQALLRYKEAKDTYALQKLIEETNDGDDSFDEDEFAEPGELDSDMDTNWDDDDQEELGNVSIEGLLQTGGEDDDEMDTDDLNEDDEEDEDSVDLMEDLFEQQKNAILAARLAAKTQEEREMQTLRLQVLVQRRQIFLEEREGKLLARCGNDVSDDVPEASELSDTDGKDATADEPNSPMTKKPTRAERRKAKKGKARSGPEDVDDDADDLEDLESDGEEPEGWMMFDDLEKEKRAREDAEEEGDSDDESDSEAEDSEDITDEDDEEEDESEDGDEDDVDEDDVVEEADNKGPKNSSSGANSNGHAPARSVKVINLTKPKPEAEKKVASPGLVDYSGDEEGTQAVTNQKPTAHHQETELERALRLNGVDDTELTKTERANQAAGQQLSSADAPNQAKGKKSLRVELKQNANEDEDEDEDEDDSSEGDDFFADGSIDFENDFADEEALLADLAKSAAAGEAGLDGGEDEGDKEDDSKEPSSFSLIKPHVLHAYYGFRSSAGPAESAVPANGSANLTKKKKGRAKKGRAKKGRAKKGRGNDVEEDSIPEDELVPQPGCPRPLVADLKPGQCLYLPASWWHEVTSMSTPEHPFHCALNFWFHPPTNLPAANETPRQPKGKKRKGGAKIKEDAAEKKGDDGGGSAAAGGGSGGQTGPPTQSPSAASPYEDTEVWDEVRRTVAKVVRLARQHSEARLQALSSEHDDEDSKELGSASSAQATESKRRRQG